jgi:hypothetical protein
MLQNTPILRHFDTELFQYCTILTHVDINLTCVDINLTRVCTNLTWVCTILGDFGANSGGFWRRSRMDVPRKGLERWKATARSVGAGAKAESRKVRFFAAQPQKMRPNP